MVYGVKERKNESALRNWFSRTIVRLINSLSHSATTPTSTPACSAS